MTITDYDINKTGQLVDHKSMTGGLQDHLDNEAWSSQSSSHHHDEENDVIPILAHRFSINMKEFVRVKGILYIEKVKDVVGGIMAHCNKKMKYEILQYIVQ